MNPIDLEIYWNRLISITDEAGAALKRTSFSTIVRESNDFACVLLDTEARLIASLRQTYGPAAPASQRATMLLCSHRLAAFPYADRIVVLDHACIVETGTHAELIPRYAPAWRYDQP